MVVKRKNKLSTSKIILYNILAIALVATILIIAALLTLSNYTKHGETIVVPDLYAMSEAQAIEKIKSAGLRAEVIDTIYNRMLPAKSILEQSIAGGSNVKEGRMIYLTISSSTPPSIVLPDIANNTSRREAETRLRAMGFRLTPPEVIKGDAEWVYEIKSRGRTLKTGSRIPADATLTLVIGNGKTDDIFNGADSIFNQVPDENVEELFD